VYVSLDLRLSVCGGGVLLSTHPSIHPSILVRLSGAGSQWQPAKQGPPRLPSLFIISIIIIIIIIIIAGI